MVHGQREADARAGRQGAAPGFVRVAQPVAHEVDEHGRDENGDRWEEQAADLDGGALLALRAADGRILSPVWQGNL